MKRRDFFKLAGLAGLTVMAPLPWNEVRSAPYEGTFWVMINASGGWDPTSFCDPKGDPINRFYLPTEIQTHGPFSHAPNHTTVGGHTEEFFTKYSSRLMVINGIDTRTNGHSDGTRHTWSGSLANGSPAFASLTGAIHGGSQPLSFITNGGYDYTDGLVAPTRFNSGDWFDRIARPGLIYPDYPDRDHYHSDSTMERIQAARKARLERLKGRQNLPRLKNTVNQLHVISTGENELTKLKNELEGKDTNPSNQLLRQARIALAAYKVGLSVSVNINFGSFDTHSNHDNTHLARLKTFLEGVDLIVQEAESIGVMDKVVLVVGSEFGRTPLYADGTGYNSGNGKDHWSVSSMMFLGQGIPNRLVGSTDSEFRVEKVNPSTLAVDPSGINITPGHIHKSLRRLAGIENHTITEKYPLSVEDLPLFE